MTCKGIGQTRVQYKWQKTHELWEKTWCNCAILCDFDNNVCAAEVEGNTGAIYHHYLTRPWSGKTQNLNFRSSLQRSWLIGKCSWVVVGGSLACCVALCCVALCCIVLYCIVLCATDYRSALPCSNPDWRPIYNDEHLQRQAAVRIPDFKFTIYNLQFSQIYE